MKQTKDQLSIFDMVINHELPTKPVPPVRKIIAEPNSPPLNKEKVLCPFKIPTVDEIIKRIDRASYSVPKSRLISDVFECGALAISNKFDLPQYDEREERYLQIIKSYKPNERELIAEIFGMIFTLLTSVVYDNGVFGDYLGELFMRCRQGEKNAGQFFTPYHVSKLLAKLSITDSELNNGEIYSIYEPCCGSGSIVMAAMEILQNDYGVNYSRDSFVVCEDIDVRCVHMAYLQLSLAGVPAIVKHQDSLSRQLWSVWRTPAYLMQYLRFRKFDTRQGDKL